MSAAPDPARGFPPLVRDMPGRRVRLLRAFSNGFCTLPAGTMGTILSGSSWRRLSFRGDPCPHCGVSPRAVLAVRDLEPANG